MVMDNLSVFAPAAAPANSISGFFLVILAILAGIFVLVEGALIYCLFRFRRPQNADGPEPPQIYGSRPIELAWTVAPVLVVFVLFLVVVRSVGEARQAEAPPGALQITVVGHRWWWEFDYPELGIRTANEMHVPVGEGDQSRPVFLQLESADVIHSFWVPRLAGKTDVIPGRHNRMWFRPLETGTFEGQCAEYCGVQHANMQIRVMADTPADFQRWVEEQQRSAVEDQGAQAGRQLFLTRTCLNCHSIRGTVAAGLVGPDLTHLRSRQTLASGMVPNNHDQLTAWLSNPQSIKPGCLMPNLHLKSEEVGELVRYLETLR